MADTNDTPPDNGPKDSKAESSVLNSPDIKPGSAEPSRRAITTAKQAHGIAEAIRTKAKNGRLKTAGIISSQYNGAPPYDQQSLTDAGQDWRNNFSTGFLASIVDRVMPQLLDPIKNATVLTHSTLPPGYPGGSAQSFLFQTKISKLIRGWSGWEDLCGKLVKETVLNGQVAPVRLSDDWRPRIFGVGECYLPDETGQHAKSVAFAVFEESMLLVNFIKLIKDKEIAVRAGFNYENCIWAANHAQGRRDDLNAVQVEDLIREGALVSNTYTSDETKRVNLYHVLVQDHTGEVDLWTVTQSEGRDIRNVQRLHGSIEQAIAPITFQIGNGTFYGSKGLGRLLANLHIAIERLRNLGADQAYLAGLCVINGDPDSIEPTVMHPFIVLRGKDVQVQKEKMTFNAQDHKLLVDDLVSIAESISGAFIPPNLQGSSSTRTKIEAAQKAEREIAVRHGVLGRFSKSFATMTTMMQRAICSPVNLREAQSAFENKQKRLKSGEILLQKATFDLLEEAFPNGLQENVKPETYDGLGDPDAVNCILEMLEEGMTIQEVARLAVTPADSDDDKEGSDSIQQTLGFIAANKMSPYIDQAAAATMEAELVLGSEKAKRLLIQQDDPNVEAVATRDQIIEFSEMMDGNAIPVAAGDNHKIHRKVLYARGTPIFMALAKVPSKPLLDAAKLILQHAAQHLQMDMMTPDEQKAKEQELIQPWVAVITRAEQALAAQAEAQAAGMMQGGQGEAPVPGAQPQEGALETPGAIPPEQLEIEQRKLDQGDRKLELEAAKHAHNIELGTVKAANETARTVADLAMQAKNEGRLDAEKDRLETTAASQ